MKQTKENINEALKELRDFIESDKDLLASRIAYEVEQGIRWAIEDTEDWSSLTESVIGMAGIIRDEIDNGKIARKALGENNDR